MLSKGATFGYGGLQAGLYRARAGLKNALLQGGGGTGPEGLGTVADGGWASPEVILTEALCQVPWAVQSALSCSLCSALRARQADEFTHSGQE